METETAPAQPPSGGLRRVARAILWPLRRFFDPRFTGIHSAVHDIRRLVITDMEAANETATLTGRTLDRLVAQNDALLARLDAPVSVTPGHEPFALAYTFRALSAVPAGASVGAVVTNDSSLGDSLKALGYDVTTELGLRTAHHEGKFDALICLSVPEASDRLRRLRHLTDAGGLFIFSAAVGPRPETGARRVYDQAGLDQLLDGWEAKDVTLIQQQPGDSWTKVGGPIADLDPEAETVAMVTATRRSA